MEPMVSEEMNGGNNTDQNQKDGTNNKDSGTKCCADCKTTKTPLWRVGPSGPKSLCNACGIRYRKKRASLGSSSSPSTTSSDRKRERQPQPLHVSCPAASDVGKGLGESARMSMSLVLLDKDFVVPTSAVAKKQRCQRKRKLGEEELAAVSLMALSCGSVFA